MASKLFTGLSVLLAGSGLVASSIAQDGPNPGRDTGGPNRPGGLGPGTFLGPQIHEAADANKDGKLSPEEASAAASAFVKAADTEKTGSVDAEALGKAINANVGPPPGGGGPPGGPGGPGGFGPGTFLAPQILQLADANKDGKLSPEEAGSAAAKFIGEADAKKAGGIDADALASAINRKMGPPGGPGGFGAQERKLVKTFDKDKNGRLDRAERDAARESIKKEVAAGPRRGFGPPRGFGGENDPPVKPGSKMAPADVENLSGKPLYEPTVLRTLFLDFEDADWEPEMAEFYNSDVEVPATLTVDGRKYPGVGVHFRGMSSFMMVKEGHKRSLNVSIDFADPKQKLYGYKTLNLLNSHEDPTFLRPTLFLEVARHYIPAPKVNFVRVVINGESWGLYVNVQQFDKTFVEENFHTEGGARWKVRGNPGADGGLRYTGDKIEDYRQRFSLKSKDDDASWKALIALCKTLEETPPDRLEAALEPMLDIDGTLWFLALDNALVNGDGYWTRASDYSIYLDPKGRFHLLPHDVNETFTPAMMFGPPGGRPGGRPGGPGGPGGRPGGPGGPGAGASGIEIDPLIGLNDSRVPLRSKLLAVPSLRAKYLDHVRTIAEEWLDWNKLGPIVAQNRALIAREVEADSRKLTSLADFETSVADTVPAQAEPARGRPVINLRDFVAKRRAYLLEKSAAKRPSSP